MTSSGATVDKRQRSRTLRALPPLLNFLIIIGSQKPLLEHFGKRSEAIPTWALYAVPFLLASVYIAVGATAFFFQPASQNINTSGEEIPTSRAVVGVADVGALGQCIG